MIDGTSIPMSLCPHCGHAMDHAADLTGTGHVPRPGDVSICMGCAGLLQFDDNLKHIPVTKEALDQLALFPEQMSEIKRMQFAVTLTMFMKKKETKQ